eukprot:5849316-Alexandrium_andersonii.AAC.1
MRATWEFRRAADRDAEGGVPVTAPDLAEVAQHGETSESWPGHCPARARRGRPGARGRNTAR